MTMRLRYTRMSCHVDASPESLKIWCNVSAPHVHHGNSEMLDFIGRTKTTAVLHSVNGSKQFRLVQIAVPSQIWIEIETEREP
jgi:hypothetical protein